MAAAKPLSVLMIDPALFTAPYDAALTAGLAANDVAARWVVRPLRLGEPADLPRNVIELEFYRGIEDSAKGRGPVWKFRKAVSHIIGGLRLRARARSARFSLVHVQWAIIPIYDALILGWISRRKPVVLTVHDLTPFNGSPTSRLQTIGFGRVLRSATRVIVHTNTARQTLIERGHDPERVVVVPHGPLALASAPEPKPPRPYDRSRRWRVVFFGKLQPYKGLDVLIEALGLMAPEQLQRIQVVIAGEPLYALNALLARIDALSLSSTVEMRLKRLDEEEMAALFDSADAFVFPYRQIEASGVLHLVLPYRRWVIASDLGAFRELVKPGRNGALVNPDDPNALAAALTGSIGRTSTVDQGSEVAGWDKIGFQTRAIYEAALAERQDVKRTAAG